MPGKKIVHAKTRIDAMITALNHISIAVSDTAAAARQLETLLARKVDTTAVQLDNLALQFTLSGEKNGLQGLAFATTNIEAAFKACERRALKPAPSGQGKTMALDTDATFGVPVSLVERPSANVAAVLADGAVTGLDHVVVRTTHPNRAVALYGARLGLDLRLDRTEPKWGTRFMFFRCGDLIIEVVHNLNEEPSDAPDKLWGLTWRSPSTAPSHFHRLRGCAAGMIGGSCRSRQNPPTFQPQFHNASGLDATLSFVLDSS